ncbi:hypothetical protein GJAV_G00237680 [Gymnothorax javanicus]|nr:hypothetical protein GJAV_G00237680 [Gymnothorax javanicus]
MALGVDGSFSKLHSRIEPKNRWRWKTRIPESTPGFHPETSREGLSQGPEMDKGGQKKMVTMAPRSRYLTGKSHYVMRKPLLATSSHNSILKKPALQEQEVEPEQGCNNLDVKLVMERMPSPLAEGTLDSGDACLDNASSLSSSGDDLSMPLTAQDLRSWSPHEDTRVVAGFHSSALSRRCVSSPSLDVLSPRWNSTQKSSSLEQDSSSSSHFSRGNRVEQRLRQSGDTSSNPGTSHALARHEKSPHRANYWACSIPSYMLPSPNRKSPSWDPDKEYESLLDYTYPLRPSHLPAPDSTDTRQLQRTNPSLLDSGIGLDRFCSSSNLSYPDQPLGERRRGPRAVNQVSTAPRELLHSKNCGRRLFGSWHSSVDQMGLSEESLLETDSKQANAARLRQKHGIFASCSSAQHFIPTSKVLPARRMVWDNDEEYHALPERLQELQVLSGHLKALTKQVYKSRTSSCESVEKEALSERTSAMLGERKSGEEVPDEDGEGCSVELEGLEASLQNLSDELQRCSLQEMESCVGHLSGVRGVSLVGRSQSQLQCGMETNQVDFETKESLMQHIKEFCSNLEQLIVWLYKIVEKTERLTPPSVEIESVKSSLADYQSFQRELNSQQPLTAAVLQKGGILLRCLDTTSPVLKDTLKQIEKQSRALEVHAEHLFSSILSAMDSLTEPSSSETEGQELKESCLVEQDLEAAGRTQSLSPETVAPCH